MYAAAFSYVNRLGLEALVVFFTLNPNGMKPLEVTLVLFPVPHEQPSGQDFMVYWPSSNSLTYNLTQGTDNSMAV